MASRPDSAPAPAPSGRLAGARVRLAAMTEADLPAVAAWREDVGAQRLLDAAAAMPRSPAELGRWLAERQARTDGFVFAVRPVGCEALLGYVEIDGILWPHRVGWVSLLIGDRAQWGRGYGGEALALALWFAFAELNLMRVQLTVFADNERAIRLYERMAFRREGVFRSFLERDGRRQDMLLYGLLRPEWEASRQDRGPGA